MNKRKESARFRSIDTSVLELCQLDNSALSHVSGGGGSICQWLFGDDRDLSLYPDQQFRANSMPNLDGWVDGGGNDITAGLGQDGVCPFGSQGIYSFDLD